MVRAGIRFALAAATGDVARAILIGAEKRSAFVDSLFHTGLANIALGRIEIPKPIATQPGCEATLPDLLVMALILR
jgi:hypothetical protein